MYPDSDPFSDPQPHTVIDFRSDTVTHPTPAMRRAMAEAPVGDDVYGEDPTVNQLEALAAQLVGKEAAVFVPSGSMGNAIAALVHLRRGDEVILGARSHMFKEEQGQLAVLAGAQPAAIFENADGTLPLDAIEDAIQTPDQHHAITRLICIENTHNKCGGVPLTAEYTADVGALAKKHGLKFHIDGARIFNAAVNQDVPVDMLTRPADSVMFCLSKGLCAPVGSMVCGDGEFAEQARRARKMLGGGMRQAGILAAAGIISLNSMIERLVNDHDDAQLLAMGLADIPGITLNPKAVRTNMVYFDLGPTCPYNARQLAAASQARGVFIDACGPSRVRMVLHYWISPVDVEKAIYVINDLVRPA
jgi:threonine aldolase